MNLLNGIQPIVLVGGKSSRFGSDKLRAVVGNDARGPILLVQRPVDALRAIFGSRVALVGDCDYSIRALADTVIPDLHPGVGPCGGILSALEGSGQDVFVLPGDLAFVTAQTLAPLIEAITAHPTALAILAQTGHPEPCVGLYRKEATEALAAYISAGLHGPLSEVIAPGKRVLVTCDAKGLTNVNRPQDLSETP